MCKLAQSLLFVFLFSSFCYSSPGETWTLSVSYKLTGKMGTGTAMIQANGSANLISDGSGKFMGKGTLSVKETVTAPDFTSKVNGKGLFSVQGRRDGKYLYFKITGAAIPLKGTIATMGQSTPHESSFDPSACTAGEASIERKEGASSAHKIKGAGGKSDVKAISLFQLKGGQNVVQKQEAPDPKQAPSDDVWTLELAATQDYIINAAGGMKGSGHDKFTGKVEFMMPSGDGPAAGEGPLTYDGSHKWTAPMPTESKFSCKGVLILDGKVVNDTLTFTPKSKLKQVDFNQSGSAPYQASTHLGDGQTLFNTTETVSLPIENGAEVINDFTDSRHGMNLSAKFIWKLHGKKIEKWRITIDDYRINYLLHEGSGANDKRCGLKVHARREIDVVIENGQFKSGQGRSSFVSIKSYSNPPWAYSCKAAETTIIGTGSDIDAERLDQVKWTKRFNPPKTEADADLKKEWEKIKKHKTPYIYPEKFFVSGTKAGKSLSLVLPGKSGYTVGIYAKLDVAAVKSHGFTLSKNKRVEMMELDETALHHKFTVTLVDGWKHADAPPTALDRTTINVKKMK